MPTHILSAIRLSHSQLLALHVSMGHVGKGGMGCEDDLPLGGNLEMFNNGAASRTVYGLAMENMMTRGTALPVQFVLDGPLDQFFGWLEH
jgi:hypothetical protein